MRPFFTLWGGQLVSRLGSDTRSFALGLWVLEKRGTVSSFAFLIFVMAFSAITVVPFAGVWVDRWPRRTFLLANDLAAGAVVLTASLLAANGALTVSMVYALTAATSILGATQQVALTAATTTLVPAARLGQAAGLGQVSFATGRVLSPVLAALLLPRIGLSGILALDLASFAVAVASLISIAFPEPQREARAATPRFLDEAAAGWRYLRAQAGLRALLVMYAISNVSMGLLLVLYQPLILSFAGRESLGTIMTGGGIGFLAGALFATALGSSRRRVRAILALTTVQGVLLIAGGLEESVWLVGAVTFLFLFFEPLIVARDQHLWQEKVPPELQGRVFAARRALSGLTLPFAMLLAGPLADRVFEPLMRGESGLAVLLGPLVGQGPGRGTALLAALVGLGLVVTALAASRVRSLTRLDAPLSRES